MDVVNDRLFVKHKPSIASQRDSPNNRPLAPEIHHRTSRAPDDSEAATYALAFNPHHTSAVSYPSSVISSAVIRASVNTIGSKCLDLAVTRGRLLLQIWRRPAMTVNPRGGCSLIPRRLTRWTMTMTNMTLISKTSPMKRTTMKVNIMVSQITTCVEMLRASLASLLTPRRCRRRWRRQRRGRNAFERRGE